MLQAIFTVNLVIDVDLMMSGTTVLDGCEEVE